MNINIKGEGVNYMKKRKTIVLIFLLVFTVINLVGCKNLSKQTKEDIYEDFQKKITKMTSYTCKAEITIINNKSESKYIMNHTYKKPSYYKLEIIEPKNLNGKTTEYYKDKIIIKNKQLESSCKKSCTKSPINKYSLLSPTFGSSITSSNCLFFIIILSL